MATGKRSSTSDAQDWHKRAKHTDYGAFSKVASSDESDPVKKLVSAQGITSWSLDADATKDNTERLSFYGTASF